MSRVRGADGTGAERVDRLHVTLFYRRPLPNYHSVERLFADIEDAMPASIDARAAVSRFVSRGVLRRLYNLFEASRRQGDVNHITGDVHYLAYALRGGKTVLTVLDLVLVHRLRGWRRAVMLNLWYRWPVRRVACVTVISQFTKDDLLQHVDVEPDKVHVIPPPVSPRFLPDPRPFGDPPRVLLVGTKPNKNLERVAEALEGLRCTVRIVGPLSAEQRAALERHRLVYSSDVGLSDDEMIREYQQCDLLCFASTFEGFGMPIAEAQAVGRPVVTSNVCSMPEVAGGAACLVDPFQVASIRAGLERVMSDASYREELVRRGFENARRFRPETIAARYAELYRRVARSGAQGGTA